ncbi:DUF6397 family protein [Streptomyces sp. NPDC057428]|uniref:DUF6397 family protein n=1 Tax=Streptomyces sp. NPDC057428 TaxID=3346129 RepID=UPI0036BCCA5F
MTVTEEARAHAADGEPSMWTSGARAAQELGLKRGEFDLAVHLGLIAAGPATGGGRPRIGVQEMERLRARPGFPAALREKVRTAGTAEGAALLGVTQARFTGLARIGCVSPVAFYLNRYRAVVWVYLVEELLAFVAQEPGLLSGRTPAGMRTMLEAGADRRARNWRTRRIDRLLKQTQDPWMRAGLEASALDPVQLEEVVDDPYERAHLARMRHAPAFGRPGSVSGREVMARLSLADEPDEILWHRVNLALELDRARDIRPAPRPGRDLLPEPNSQPPLPGRRSAPRLEAGADSGPASSPYVDAPYVAGVGRESGRPGADKRLAAARATRPSHSRPGRGRGFLARVGWGALHGKDH